MVHLPSSDQALRGIEGFGLRVDGFRVEARVLRS